MDEALSLSPSLQDYLKAILYLAERESSVRITDLAKLRDVAKASVTEAINTLAELRLVRHDRYGPVELTELGRKYAEKVRERHTILTVFLVEVLNVPHDVAKEDACLMEHIVSPLTIDRLVTYLEKHVNQDVDGLLADTEKGVEDMTTTQVRPLSEFTEGMKGQIVRIGARGRLRRRLLDMGLIKGADIEHNGAAPLGDPIEVTTRGYHLTLRKNEAAQIYVEVD